MVARPKRRPFFHFTIPEGFYALVTRHGAHAVHKDQSTGTQSPVWPSGLHLGPPWLKVSHLVTKQSMLFNTEIKGCKTKDNVTVMMDMSVVLRVMGDPVNDRRRSGDDPYNVYKFVHEVTPVGLQAQLSDALAEAVRILARRVYHTEVFGLRNVGCTELEGMQEKLFSKEAIERQGVVSHHTQEQKDTEGEHDYYDALEANFNIESGVSIMDGMKLRLNRQFYPQGVEIQHVIIKDIRLPDVIQGQMSQKTMVISQNAMQRMQQKHDMLSLIQSEEITTLSQTHNEARKELIEDGNYERILQNLQLEMMYAEGDRQIKTIETQRDIDVELVEVESNLTVQRIEDETKLETERIREQSKADSEILLGVMKAEVDVILARGELDIAKTLSKGDKG